MAIKRQPIHWRLRALPATVEYLDKRYRRGNTLNLDRTILVLPGGRAGRRLLDLLLTHCEEQDLTLLPPIIETASTFPERLYDPKLPFATTLTQLLAWEQAAKNCDGDQLRHVIPHPPENVDLAAWTDIAQMLWRLHRELSADAIDFDAVVTAGESLPEFGEQDRWRALRQIQQAYLRILDELNLWDLQTARLYAIAHHECHTEHDIVLVGAVDLNRAIRQMLDQVSDRVVALVFAPPEFLERFDDHGCLIADRWEDISLDIAADQVHMASGPAEQAEEVLSALASYQGKYRADQIAIGLPDDRLRPSLERALASQGIASRWVVGRKLSETAPYKLLEAVADFVESGRFRDFGTLVRHPDVYDWLLEKTGGRDWLKELDVYYTEHLQSRLGDWLGDSRRSALLKEVHRQVESALKPLSKSRNRSLIGWAEPIAGVLSHFYETREIDRDTETGHYLARSLQAIRKGLLEFQSLPQNLAPQIDAVGAIRFLLEQLSAEEVSSPAAPAAIEMLGWLELPLDTAPALIVTSFNEGIIPGYQNSDLFLPNAIRRELGLADNQRRYARDAYAVSVLLASRENLHLIFARRDADHYPLAPSRLLFACDDNLLVRRVLTYFKEHDGPRRKRFAPQRVFAESGFPVPRPLPLETSLSSVNVTAFRTYLECPYRFYLRHVRGLEVCSDDIDEMGAAVFGNVAHKVLEYFGQDRVRDSSNADEIYDFLNGSLNEIAMKQFGSLRMPAVDIQLMQLRARLSSFAIWQASWRQQGWIIEQTEIATYPQPPVIRIGNRTLNLKGRIDRLDRNQRTGDWMVFDYKTSDSGKSPAQTHLRAGSWVDLQLPLYRVLAQAYGIPGPVKLGYVVLPKDPTRTGARIADWSEAEFEAADRVAADVAGKILDGVFWPPRSTHLFQEFNAICQHGILV